MKKIAAVLLVLSAFPLFAQQEDAWVYFDGKLNAADYLSNPTTMLTQRALDRRSAQNIALDFKDVPVTQAYIDQVEAANGISVMAKSKWFNAVHVRGTQAQINALQALSFVASVDFADNSLDPAGRHKPQPQQQALRAFQKQFEVAADFNYGNSANQIQMLNGHLLHQMDYTGAGKVIAVMDGGYPGVDTAQPFARLRDNNQILGGYDFVSRSSDFYGGISHGTMVLSTMGGYRDSQLVGTAPDASYYLYITEDGDNESPLEESLWVEAAEEADRVGADIITTSLGYSNFDNPAYSHVYEDMDGLTAYISRGLDIAFSRGMICVVSAGNEGSNDWYYITAPADAFSALTVGAVNAAGNSVGFSSHGPSADGRVKPDVAAKGQQATVSNTQGNITTANGTSFSCPIIAGMVASFWQALPGRRNDEIMQLIKESSSQYSSPDDDMGYGIPNFALALENALGTKGFSASGFAVYPNPAESSLNINLPSANGSFVLYNTLGARVKQQELAVAQSSISLDGLERGMYLYTLQSGGKTFSGKLLKK